MVLTFKPALPDLIGAFEISHLSHMDGGAPLWDLCAATDGNTK